MVVPADLLKQITALSDSEWQEVMTARKAMQQFKNGTETFSSLKPIDEHDGMVLDVIATTMSQLGVEHLSTQFLRKHPNYSTFKNKCKNVMTYISATVRQKNEQRFLLRIGIELLYRDLTEMNVAVSGRTVMNHIHRFPAVVNRHFPGYADAGLLGMIVKARA